MNSRDIVTPSSQVDATLPLWIRSPDVVVEGTQYNSYSQENHRNFVDFMTRSGESQERLGYSENLLQNLLKYKDFNTYRNPIIEYSTLVVNIDLSGQDTIVSPEDTIGNDTVIATDRQLILSAEETEELEINNGYGFPEENGVVLIDDEVILYRRREGNKLHDLRRGSSAVSILPTFRHEGEYKYKTTPSTHAAGAVVYNLSVLFLVSILDQIHKTYAHKIDASRVVPEVNRDTLLKNIKDFFRSKGSKLGIKALFKIFFNENDVDVFYPGDRMIKPSVSTWAEGMILRTVPIPKVFCDPEDNYALPDKTIGSSVELKAYSSVTIDKEGNEYFPEEDDVFAKSFSDYTVSYQYGEETQYEIYLSQDDLEGEFIANPNTRLTRSLYLQVAGDSPDERRDTTTVTVESTLGFPNRGVIFVDEEAIFYTNKTPNQFLNCHRGYIGVNARHTKGAIVYGPYYVETNITDKDGVNHVSRSWPLGLVESVSVEYPGLLHQLDTKITPNGPGLIDLREQILISNYGDGLEYTFLENYDDELTQQSSTDPQELAYVGNRTHGPDGIYFDDKYVFVSSSGFPSYKIGKFITDLTLPVDDRVGVKLESDQVIGVIPRRNTIKPNIITEEPLKYIFESKGTDIIGIFVDGVRAYSNQSPKKVIQGRVVRYDVFDKGYGYKNPTLLTNADSNGDFATADIEVSPVTGEIISITPTSDNYFIDNPVVQITSGRNAILNLTFDTYGRITDVQIANSGEYYNDVPTLKIVDETGVGKGGLLACEVTNGEISAVKILNAGIDYNKLKTTVEIIPQGSGAIVTSLVESYDINRYTEVTYNSKYQFDSGNGFLFEPEIGVEKKYFGYVCDPIDIRRRLEDYGVEHSPILGWAFDGNPIYGPWGYKNKKNGTDGLERQQSAYRLLQARANVIPDGGTLPGIDPPGLADYPMGSFIQDYKYDPEYYSIIGPIDDQVDGYLANEIEEFLLTDEDKLLEIYAEFNPGMGLIKPDNLLDENNGKICNTPEFPEELYPDGVYCYFITIDDSRDPQFPYIIGKTFNNRPISQKINIISQESLSVLPKGLVYRPSQLDGQIITFDFEKVERLRNPYLESTKDGLKLEMGEVSTGNIKDIIIELPLPSNCSVGDRIFFDNSKAGGAGAQAIVSLIAGENVVDSGGSPVKAVINSHRQRLDLSDNYDADGNVIFYSIFEDSLISLVDPSNSAVPDKEIRVVEYRSTSNIMFAQTTTLNIPTPGDIGIDAKKRPFTISEVLTLEEEETTTELWFGNVNNFEPNDVVVVRNGSEFDNFIPDEYIKILSIDGLKVNVLRGVNNSEPKPIEDGTEVEYTNKFVYKIQTQNDHRLEVGDFVQVSGSEYEEVNGSHQIVACSNNEFEFFVSQLYGADTNVTYTVGNYNIQGQPEAIEVISPGFGYDDLPVCLGIYKRFVDRGEFKINIDGTQIGSVDVLNGGARYVNPTVVFVDSENRGSGAEAEVELDDGKIKSITITDPGENYVDPAIYLVEMDGKYVSTTDNIGKIKSVKVLNPGRNISADRSLKPELRIQTRFVIDTPEVDGLVIFGGSAFDNFDQIADCGVSSPANPVLTVDHLLDLELEITHFIPGMLVFQGIANKRTAEGKIVDFDETRNILTIDEIDGKFIKGEPINSLGTIATITEDSQADCRVVVNGSSTPEGRFIDDTGLVSESYAVIQDSYRYQWFSYVIASPIQQVDYGQFVREIIHPAGFIQFADLRLHDSIEYVERNRIRQEVVRATEIISSISIDEDQEPVIIRSENLERGGMAVVGEDDVITSVFNDCAPFVLLGGDYTPILSSTVNGDKFTLVKLKDCNVKICDTFELTDSNYNPILSGTDDGYQFTLGWMPPTVLLTDHNLNT